MIPISLLTLIFIVVGCESDDDKQAGVKLDSFGPTPALRGGELRFIGHNLDQVTTIILPDNVEVNSFVSKSKDEIVLVIPKETAVEGKIILKTPGGDIETVSDFEISEPITITELEPASVLPDGELTIKGTYLNLISEIIFSTNKSVTEFESQSEEEIVVTVPEDAQTGFIVLSNGEEIPLLVKSGEQLTVITPAVTSLAPTTIKAGATLTITGTNLDLTESVTFPGNTKVTTFVSQSETEIKVVVPSNSQDGKVTLRPLSNVEVISNESLTMVVPTISALNPNPGKNGGTVTITGTNLDLVNKVTFGGNKTGTIQGGGTATQITVSIPADATEAVVTLGTTANKSVESSSTLTLVKPAITSFTPTSVQTVNNPSITITGTNLDIVSKIVFEGGFEASVAGATATQIVSNVVPGSLSGPFKLITTNGTEVVSSTDLTIVPNVPNITGIPADAYIGALLTLTGTNMNVAADVIFPGDKKATIFGTKSATTLEVYVPDGATVGVGKIKFVTTKNEIYESPSINIKRLGVEPIQNQDLVFFNFNGTGKDSWWGGVSSVNDGNSIDGTSYGRINNSYSGWTDLFWRNSKNNFPGDVIGTDVANYVLKFDVRVLAPVTGGNIKFRLEGTEGDFWYMWGPAGPSGQNIPTTVGWTTITVPISAFKDGWGWGTNSPTDLSKVTGAFGAAFDNGSSAVNIMIDNIRFHKIN
jgi:hypothetical protein